jgi:RNA polymerase sigma factor (sigma-70 family)
MLKPDIFPFDPAETSQVLRQAQASGRLPYDELDRLLLDACETEGATESLLDALASVCIVDALDPNDLLNDMLELGVATRSFATGDNDFRQYAEQTRTLRRLTRSEEHLLARRLEFARARLRRLVEGTLLPEAARDRVLDRGLNRLSLRRELEDQDVEDIDGVLASVPSEAGNPLVSNVLREYGRLRGHSVERGLYQVINMAYKYRTYGVPMMDLIQEGNASLIRAVEKFDWRQDVRFQTYATFWIRQAIERLITANRGMVRVPNYIQQKLRRLRREGKLPRNHKDMNIKDVAELFGISLKAATRLMETDRFCYSLDFVAGNEDDTYAAMLVADEVEPEMLQSERLELTSRITRMLEEVLVPAEREVVTKRYGLDGKPCRTLQKIGDDMHLSRERIRQMERKALAKLGKGQTRIGLEAFL